MSRPQAKASHKSLAAFQPLAAPRSLTHALVERLSADIVSGRALKERTRRNVDLWAACIGGAIPRASYFEAVDAAGFAVQDVRRNDYRFVSERALDACSTYEVQSVSLMAVKVS